MIEYIAFAAIGAFAGFVRSVVTGKGVIKLPKIDVKDGHKFINLGVLASIIIGLAAGSIAPYSTGVDAVVAFLAGYCGADFIENLIERSKGMPK